MDGEGCKRGVGQARKHRAEQEELDSSERLLCLERHGGGWRGLKIFQLGMRYGRGHAKHDQDVAPGHCLAFKRFRYSSKTIMTSGMVSLKYELYSRYQTQR
jgi:hypothetical protein